MINLKKFTHRIDGEPHFIHVRGDNKNLSVGCSTLKECPIVVSYESIGNVLYHKTDILSQLDIIKIFKVAVLIAAISPNTTVWGTKGNARTPYLPAGNTSFMSARSERFFPAENVAKYPLAAIVPFIEYVREYESKAAEDWKSQLCTTISNILNVRVAFRIGREHLRTRDLCSRGTEYTRNIKNSSRFLKNSYKKGIICMRYALALSDGQLPAFFRHPYKVDKTNSLTESKETVVSADLAKEVSGKISSHFKNMGFMGGHQSGKTEAQRQMIKQMEREGKTHVTYFSGLSDNDKYLLNLLTSVGHSPKVLSQLSENKKATLLQVYHKLESGWTIDSLARTFYMRPDYMISDILPYILKRRMVERINKYENLNVDIQKAYAKLQHTHRACNGFNFDNITNLTQIKPSPLQKGNLVMKETLQNVKESAKVAAQLELGRIANKKVAKAVKGKLPLVIRGYAEQNPALVGLVMASLVPQLAAYAPERADKLQMVGNAMRDAAMLELVQSFDIEGLIDSLLDSVTSAAKTKKKKKKKVAE